MFGHDPPIKARSITTTGRPCWASSHARYLPASPPPRTTFSICTVSFMVELTGVPSRVRFPDQARHAFARGARRACVDDAADGCRLTLLEGASHGTISTA